MLKLNGAVALITCALIISGCSEQSVQSTSNDISHGLQSANTAAKQVGQEVQPSLQKLDLGARVTAALRANANLPDSIRVDASTKGVRLRGHVETAAQKSLAGKIAKSTLPPDKSVDNELKIASG
jgi:osmotically-inducible protein OsmY